jgi:hypothetical protein
VIKKENAKPQINIDHFEIDKLEENAKNDVIGKQKYEEDLQKRWENYQLNFTTRINENL